MPSSDFNTEEEVKSAQDAIGKAKPLLILLIPIIIVNVVLELVLTLVGMVLPKSSPDAKGVPGATPVPVKTSYAGNILGFFKYLGAMGDRAKMTGFFADGPNGDTGSRVWVDNHGLPVVSVNDATSNKPLVEDYDLMVDKRVEYPTPAHPESLKANFYRSGERAAQFRCLYIEMVPRTIDSEQFKFAIEGMKVAARRWIASNDGPGDITSYCRHCVVAFASNLVLGEELPLELLELTVSGISPSVPFSMLYYPRFWWPAFQRLLPAHWGMEKAREHIHARVRACPRWPKIQEKAIELSLTPEEACDSVIPMLWFNAMGLRHSFQLSLEILPKMDFGKELVKDEKRLQSFALETLRFNGPVAVGPAKHEPTIIKTSAGATHAVKKGTLLSTLFQVSQMDPNVWPEPHSFKDDRYMNSSRTETKRNPWPTLCHSQPLGSIDDEERYKRSHMCVMARLNYRVIMEFIRMVAVLPRYDLDAVTDDVAKKNVFTRQMASTIAFVKVG